MNEDLSQTPPKDPETKFSFKIVFSWFGNSRVNVPIFVAIAGLIYGIIVLDGKGCNTNPVYHGLYLENKKELADTIISQRIVRLKKLETQVKQQKRIADSLENKNKKPVSNPKPPAESTTLPKDKPDGATKSSGKADTLSLIAKALLQSQKELETLRYSNADTSLTLFMNYFTVNREKLWEVMANERNEKCELLGKGIDMTERDTFSLVKREIPKTINVKIGAAKQVSLMRFFGQYPNFGFWFFLALAQITMWFILIPILIGIARRTNDIVPTFPYNVKNGVILSIIPLVTIGLFVWFIYRYIIDTFIISDCDFLDGFVNRMIAYSFWGYFVTVVCFGVYLFLANKLQLLNTARDWKRLSENEDLQKEYKSLKNSFDMAFLISAIILSVFVLWTGVMFNAINGLEAPRFYELVSGQPFLNYNFVYLIGLIHTIILLIFYIPVRLQFNSLEITQAQKDIDEKAISGAKKGLKTFWESLGTILLTTSPLITTLLEKVISGFFE